MPKSTPIARLTAKMLAPGQRVILHGSRILLLEKIMLFWFGWLHAQSKLFVFDVLFVPFCSFLLDSSSPKGSQFHNIMHDKIEKTLS